jgi:uncharacterized protein YjdB
VRKSYVPMVLAGAVVLASGCTSSDMASLNIASYTTTVSPHSQAIGVSSTFQLTQTTETITGGGSHATSGVDAGWTSRTSAVATVSSLGLVTGVSPGTAVIVATPLPTASAAAGAKISADSAFITVLSTGVTVTPAALSLDVGSSGTLVCAYLLGGAAQPGATFAWSSADQTIATVSSTGGVTGVKAGGTTVTCTLNQQTSLKATAAVTVKSSSIAMDVQPSRVPLEVGQTTTLGVTATSGGTVVSNPSLSFSSDNPNVATVNSQGTITGVGTGSANVTVSTPLGGTSFGISTESAATSVTVPVTVTATTTPKVVVTPNPAFVNIGATVQLSMTVNGGAPPNQFYTSADQSIAHEVNTSTGVVSGVSAGATVVRASTVVTSGGVTAGYPGATVIDVQGPPETCAASGTYNVTTSVQFDPNNSSSYIPMPLPLTLTVTNGGAGAVTVTGPAPFVGGTGTINNNCDISITSTNKFGSFPNVKMVVIGRLASGAGNIRLVFQVGTNGALPNNVPLYYALKN